MFVCQHKMTQKQPNVYINTKICGTNYAQWMIPAIDEILIQTRRTKTITIAGKSVLKRVKLQRLVAKCCNMRKI